MPKINPLIAPALIQLADMANCISGDFHLMHLNMYGSEFDRMHKKVLKEYYEQAAEDYDSLAEWASCYGGPVPNPNESAVRTEYQSLQEGLINRERAVKITNVLLEQLCGTYLEVFKTLEKEMCPIATGITNWLQTRLEYWSKEMAYFNKRREDVTTRTEPDNTGEDNRETR